MTCQFAEANIQKSLDGMLSQSDRQALDSHLESCAACRQELEAQRRLSHLADRWISRSLARSDPGEAFNASVLSRLETNSKPSWLNFGLPLMVTMLLLAALVFLPGMPHVGDGAVAQTLHRLPLWLLSSLSSLPGDTLTLIRLPQANLLPSWTGALLLAVIVLNSAFCIHARQLALRRSLS
ncbi:MAG: anti-sigma factor family protein [Janthinobacterium lividum]